MQSAYKWTYTKNTYLESSNGKTKDFCLCFFFIAGLEKCLIMPLDIYNTLNIMKYILQKKEIP